MSYQTNTLTINDAAYFNGLQDGDAICANELVLRLGDTTVRIDAADGGVRLRPAEE